MDTFRTRAAAFRRPSGAPFPLTALLAMACLFTSSAFAQPPDATFLAPVNYPTSLDPWPVVVADLNADGLEDLIVGNEGTNTVSVMLATAPGEFPGRVDYFTGGTAPRGLAVGHLNADGAPDLVVANYLGNSLGVLMGDGAGGFAAPVTYPVGTGPYDVAIGDVDGTGAADVVVASAATSSVAVFLNSGSGSLQYHGAFGLTPGSWPTSVALVDLDADGRNDLVTANYATATVAVLYGASVGLFGTPGYLGTGPEAWGMYVGDLNDDGRPDIATASGSGTSVLLNAGNRGFFAPVAYASGGTKPTSIDAADLNFDGTPDLVVGHLGGPNLGVLLSNGDGTFAAAQLVPVGDPQHGLVVADLNDDNRIDIVATKPGPDLVAVLRNNIPITLFVETTPNPSGPGESVAIDASLSSMIATGDVDFYDDGLLIGSAPLASGSATLAYSSFALGANQVLAVYSGDGAHPADSATTVHYVKEPSSLELASNPNPTLVTQPLELTATVTPPGTGQVHFYDGGIPIGSAPVEGDIATLPLDSLSFGVHLLRADFEGDALLGSTDTLTHVVNPVVPQIVAVRDVPADQGGSVFLTWRFYLDRPPFQAVTGYRIWRRVPPAAAARMHEAAAHARIERFVTSNATGGTDESFWEAIADLPAAQLQNYGFTAATTRDSMAGDNPLTAFFVQALTAQPFVYYSSQPDSGYSVDNLAPAQPQTFVGVYSGAGVALHWLRNGERDLAGYRLHRGATADFLPGEDNLVTAQPDTGHFDAEGAYSSYYKLAAVDIHGNRSPFALVTPDLPTPTIVSIQNVTVSPGRVALVWLAADGRRVSVYRRTPDEGWRQLGEREPDGENRIYFEDDGVASGRYGYRIGIQRGDGETFAGEVWVDVPRFDLALEVAPNPATALPLGARFTLPAAGPAEIRLFDVSGRIVAEREVGGLGPGVHSLALAPREGLRPGVYLMQLRFGAETRLRRVVLMR